MGREFELKYRCTEDTLEAIRENFGDFTQIEMKTTYYDTFDGKLRNAQWTLRRREENGISVCTLKTPAAGGARSEWEVESSSIMGAVPMLCKLGAPIRLMELCVNGVIPVCSAAFTRLAKTLELSDGTAELAQDRGVLRGGSREVAFAEVEMEAKTCSDAAAIAFAKQLETDYSLTEEPRSKFFRGMLLACGGEIG